MLPAKIESSEWNDQRRLQSSRASQMKVTPVTRHCNFLTAESKPLVHAWKVRDNVSILLALILYLIVVLSQGAIHVSFGSFSDSKGRLNTSKALAERRVY